jgi:hypothetical protein
MLPPRHALVALPLVAAVLCGCPPRPVLDFGRDGEAKSADELLKRVALAESQVVALKGDGALYIDAPQGKGSVGLFAAVAHPAWLHLEQLDFFNRPQGVLVTDGTDFGLYDAKEGRYYRGPASPANLGRFLPIVLPPEELVALMLGRAPRITAESTSLSVDPALGVYVLTLRRGPVTQVLHVQPPSHRVVKSTVQGARAYDLELSDLRDSGSVTLPRRVRLVAADAQVTVELTWKDVALNEAPDLTLFERTAPDDVPVTEVDERGVPR